MADFKASDKPSEGVHTLALTSRTHAELSGVTEVLSFDETAVVLSTVCGELTVEGEDLRVGTLDMTRGLLVIDGKVNTLYYTETRQTRKRGFFGGAFR